MSTKNGAPMSTKNGAAAFTEKQGQYLAFIHAYTLVLGRPPAERDLQRHFGVTPPTVHQMILSLANSGFVRRTPGASRSIELLLDPAELPVLRPPHGQPIKSPVPRY
jgi:DNA-binding MarR family transcriptional regulator